MASKIITDFGRKVIPVDPIYRIPDKVIEPNILVDRAINAFWRFERDRAEWIRRRETYYLGWDDYSTPSRKGLWEGSSNLRFPLTEIQATAMHALIMQAVFFYYPLFYVDPQEEVSVQRIKKIELMMKYVVERYANYNKGIYNAVDDWAWDLVTEGIGIFSRGWDIVNRRFIDVIENPNFKQQSIDLRNLLEDTEEKKFGKLADQLVKTPYMEQARIRTIFNGPILVAEDPVFILFKGEVVDCTDLNEHQTVIKVCYFTREQLVTFRDSEYMDEDVVNEILSGPSDHKVTSTIQGFSNTTRAAKDFQTGVNTSNPDNVEETWEVLCCYDTFCLNPKDRLSMPDRLQYFVRPKGRNLLRWTYLDRVSANGKIPLHMAHLYRRPRRSTGRGMVQTMFNMNDSLDILLNQAIDSGTLANNPMFGFKADSSFDPQEVRVEPGLGIPMDDPQRDIYFYRWGINPNWSQQIMGSISGLAQQLTAIGPNTVGMVGENVGPLRSASGVDRMASQANIIHDVLIKRAKMCLSDVLEGLYMDCQLRMPQKLMVTVTGADGIPQMNDDGTVMTENITREEMQTRVHFGLYATSQSMNKVVEQGHASEIAQMLLQKAAITTGVVGPNQIYEIYANFLKSRGIPNQHKYIQKPGPDTAVPLKYELVMIMEGFMPPVSTKDPDRQDKIDMYEKLVDSPETQKEVYNGVVSPNALKVLAMTLKKHLEFQKMEQQPIKTQNQQGANQSPTAMQQHSKTPTPQQPSAQGQNMNTPQEVAPTGAPSGNTPGGQMNG